MENNIRPPRMLLIIAAVLLVFAFIAGQYVAAQSPEVLTRAVLLSGTPFLAVFVAIILAFVYLIFLVAARFSGKISPRAYRPIEMLIIGGIVVGVIGMFQPFTMFGYQWGFILLLISMLAFNIWSHVTPRGERLPEDPGPVSIQEVERETLRRDEALL